MRINTEKIKDLGPCKVRLDNYLKHYPDFDGSLEDFIMLKELTYDDKVWVFVRIATPEQNVRWSLLCASKVLSIFEENCPGDKRPRQALESVKAWLNSPTKENAYAVLAAAYDARAASDAATAYAARAAAYAAVYAALAAYDAAVYAARDAYAASNAAVYAARDAAYAASDAADYARENEEHVNLLMMVDALWGA